MNLNKNMNHVEDTVKENSTKKLTRKEFLILSQQIIDSQQLNKSAYDLNYAPGFNHGSKYSTPQIREPKRRSAYDLNYAPGFNH